MLNTRLIRRVMPLKLRATGLGSGIDKDRPDYTVYSGEWDVGRIYQTRGGPRQSALVLVANSQRSYDALGPRGDLGRSQGAVSEELGRLEGVGGVGRGGVNLGDVEPCESAMLPVSRPLGLPLH